MAKGATAAASSKVDVGAVNVELVKRELIERVLVGQGESPKVMKGHSLEGLITILQNGYQASLSKKDLTQCTECKGISPLALDSCPYCGFAGADDDADEAEHEEEKDPKDTIEARGEVVFPERESGIVKKNDKLATIAFSEKALDEATGRILKLKQQGANTFWQLGHELGEVYKADLWKARLDAKKVKYKTFKQYVDSEIKISMPHVMNMIDVAKDFTEAQVAHVGGTKLSLLLQLPPSLKTERQEVMEEIERGASHRDVKDKVRKLRQKHGVKSIGKERRTKRGLSNPTGKGGRKGTGRMTVSMAEGVVRLNMYAKPEHKLKDDEKLEDQKRAKNVGDEPIAVEQLPNGLTCVYSVLKSSKGWVLKIERVRS
jgi:hypothetical protein